MRSIDDWVRDPGACLAEFRTEHDLTLKETSVLVHTGVSHLSDIERHNHEPSMKLLREFLWLRTKPTEYLKTTARNRIEGNVRWTP